MTSKPQPQLTSNSSAGDLAGKMAISLQGLSPRVQDLHHRVKQFIEENVLTLDALKVQRLSQPGINRWEVMPELEEAKVGYIKL